MILSKFNKANRLFFLLLVVILLLTFWSGVIFRQRMLFVDPAWISFNIINHHTFAFAEHRFGAFITQVVPLVGVYLGCSLKTILLLYSLSFYLFYLSAFLILGLLLKQKSLALLLVVYLTLFISDGYYWPNNEVHQGIAWMLLFIGLNRYRFQRKHNAVLGYIFSIVLLFLAISCHLLVALPLLFLWYYVHRESGLKDLMRNGRFVLTTVIILLLLFGKYQLSRNGWYDASKLEGVEQLNWEKIVGVLHSGQLVSFGRLLLQNYWLALVVFGGSLWVLLQMKHYLVLMFWLLCLMAYGVLIGLTFPDAYGRSMQFYMESEWAALAILLATPLAFKFAKSETTYVFLVFAIFFGIRLVYIFDSFSYFDARYQRLNRFVTVLQQKDIEKAVIVEDQQQSENDFIMNWGLPVESMMLSELNGYPKQTTFKIISAHPENLMRARDSFYAPFDIKSTTVLNPQYFRLDSTQNYQILSAIDFR